MAFLLPGAGGGGSPRQAKPGWVAWLLLGPLLLWLFLFVVAPTALMVWISFCERSPLGSFEPRFTLENYARAFDPVYLKIIGRSIWFAFLTALLCLAAGYPVAYYIGRAPERARNTLLLLVMIPFWTSFLIRTYAWITILANQGLLNGLLLASGLRAQPFDLMYTPFAVVLGLVYNYLPFAILPIYGSVEKLDFSLIEAAYDLGARPFRAFWHVILPLTRPGVVAGFFLVFVPAIAMFAITTLMGGGANPTVGEVIQKQFSAARNQPFGAALGTLLLALFLVALWFTRGRELPRPAAKAAPPAEGAAP